MDMCETPPTTRATPSFRRWVVFAVGATSRPLAVETDWVFFFQAEDGIRDRDVTGVQTCALPISCGAGAAAWTRPERILAEVSPRPRAKLLSNLPYSSMRGSNGTPRNSQIPRLTSAGLAVSSS